jgi:hypothetical protein
MNTLSAYGTRQRARQFWSSLGLVLVVQAAPAIPIATLVDPAFSVAGSAAGQYDFATVSMFINPVRTRWIAWNNATNAVIANPGCAGGLCLGPGGFGTDDFIRLTVRAPGGASLAANLDQNTAFGNSFGTQNVIFGSAANAPDAIRTSPSFGSPPNTTTIFNEAGSHNALFSTAGVYGFDFSFQNNNPGPAGHPVTYLLVENNTAGTFGTVGPAFDIGGGFTLEFDQGELVDVGAEVGEGASLTERGARHGLDAQSFGRAPRVTKSSTVDRSFFFESGGSAPQLVNLFAGLEGDLFADLGGNASVSASVALFDEFNNLIDESVFGVDIDAGIRELVM